ncbi:MAG: hypothetical protein QXP42_05860 [Candidatus Micrarchaeia archaeon]
MKKFTIVLLVASLVYSLNLTTDKETYFRGETIYITGTSDRDSVRVIIKNEDRVLYDYQKPVVGGIFAVVYTIENFDPTGIWNITVRAGLESASKSISVAPRREEAFYLVSFVEPSQREYARTESISLLVRITDAGVPVRGAEAYAWVCGNKVQLVWQGGDRYGRNYRLPFNTKTGFCNIDVIAIKNVSGTLFGGENNITIEVVPADIIVKFIEPTSSFYQVGEGIPIKVNVSYSGGIPFENEKIYAEIGRYRIPLEHVGGGIYRTTYKPPEDFEGVLSIFISVSDNAGNRGSDSISVSIGGRLQWFIRTNMPVILVAIVVFVPLLVGTILIVRFHLYKENLLRRREWIALSEKKIQESYLKKGTLDRYTYERKMAELESELTGINKKLDEISKGRVAAIHLRIQSFLKEFFR